MSATYELKAQLRDRTGKGAARELRRNNLVPAVIYGDKKDPLAIAVSYKELAMRIEAGGFTNTIATIDINGEKHRVLPKDFQTDPVRDFFTHVDFLRVGANTRVVVEIPVHYINEEKSPGLKRGGVLNVVRHHLEVSCGADAIPEYFEVNLDGLEIEDVVHASAIKLPAGIKLTITDRDPTMCSIAAPTVSLASDEETPAAAEVPVVGKKEAE